MNLDKNNLDLELLDDLTMMVVVAKCGIDCYYTESNGDERLIHEAQEYYLIVSEEIENLLVRWLEARDNAPDSPHQLNPRK